MAKKIIFTQSGLFFCIRMRSFAKPFFVPKNKRRTDEKINDNSFAKWDNRVCWKSSNRRNSFLCPFYTCRSVKIVYTCIRKNILMINLLSSTINNTTITSSYTFSSTIISLRILLCPKYSDLPIAVKRRIIFFQ